MIIFVTFETEFCSFGGLGAVMKLLPREIGPSECAIIAPHFRKLLDLKKLKAAGSIQSFETLFTFQLLVRGVAHPIDVIEVVQAQGIRLFLLSSPDFFRAPDNPYVNPCNPDHPLDPYRNPINTDALTEDALFFCAAVPVAVSELAKENKLTDRHIILHLQDWETAAVANAVRRTVTYPAVQSMKCVLTIHNPYDKPLHEQCSQRVCDLAGRIGIELNRSVLEQAIPLLDAPVSTVSTHFAHELRNEVLYTQIFCPHLQRVFKDRGLVGIDNGVFGPMVSPFSESAVAAARAGDVGPMLAEKSAKRAEFAEMLREATSARPASKAPPVWGHASDLSDPALPVFLLLGRDDPRQKGFDVMAEAIRAMPKNSARYMFAVMPGDEGLPGLEFLRRLAEERPDDVCVFPSRVDKAMFRAMQHGSSFLVMGSMYEPFGAATEGYLAGMPVVGRAIGGLVQQVVPHPVCMEDEDILSLYGRQLARRYHPSQKNPTGILFREHASFADEVDGWRAILDCRYWEQNPKTDRIQDRTTIPLFRRMVASATAALRFACKLHQDPDQYGAMICNGWDHLQNFPWDKSVRSYRQLMYRPAS